VGGSGGEGPGAASQAILDVHEGVLDLVLEQLYLVLQLADSLNQVHRVAPPSGTPLEGGKTLSGLRDAHQVSSARLCFVILYHISGQKRPILSKGWARIG